MQADPMEPKDQSILGLAHLSPPQDEVFENSIDRLEGPDHEDAKELLAYWHLCEARGGSWLAEMFLRKSSGGCCPTLLCRNLLMVTTIYGLSEMNCADASAMMRLANDFLNCSARTNSPINMQVSNRFASQASLCRTVL